MEVQYKEGNPDTDMSHIQYNDGGRPKAQDYITETLGDVEAMTENWESIAGLSFRGRLFHFSYGPRQYDVDVVVYDLSYESGFALVGSILTPPSGHGYVSEGYFSVPLYDLARALPEGSVCEEKLARAAVLVAERRRERIESEDRGQYKDLADVEARIRVLEGELARLKSEERVHHRARRSEEIEAAGATRERQAYRNAAYTAVATAEAWELAIEVPASRAMAEAIRRARVAVPGARLVAGAKDRIDAVIRDRVHEVHDDLAAVIESMAT